MFVLFAYANFPDLSFKTIIKSLNFLLKAHKYQIFLLSVTQSMYLTFVLI